MLPAFVAIIAAAHLNDCTGPAVANPVTVLEKSNPDYPSGSAIEPVVIA